MSAGMPGRAVAVFSAVIVVALLVMLGVSLASESVMGATFCFADASSIATLRWARARTVASSIAGLCAFVVSAEFFIATLQAPTPRAVAGSLVFLALGVSGLVHAWTIRFGARLRPTDRGT